MVIAGLLTEAPSVECGWRASGLQEMGRKHRLSEHLLVSKRFSLHYRIMREKVAEPVHKVVTSMNGQKNT